jgi:ferredoxin-thioredoxin reductase catalytic chain
MSEQDVTLAEINALREKLDKEAEAAGYHLNPDVEFVNQLMKGMLVNLKRYGYMSCPCRLASGNRADDLDIICACDYRDPDLTEYGACYCALYVSGAIKRGEKKVGSIPERRPPPEQRKKKKQVKRGNLSGVTKPVWRCKVCGYLCARDEPPELCPICKANKDRFEKFLEPT